MKSLLKLFVVAALAMTGTAAEAQTWSFDVAEWSVDCGNAEFDLDKNVIRAKEYQWGCVGLTYHGTKTVSTSQNRLCITGKYLTKSDNGANPNIHEMIIGQDEVEVISNSSQLRCQEINDRQTLIIFNVSEKLSGGSQASYEADGTVQIRQLGFYINQTKSGNDDVFFIIDDIRFLTEAEADALKEEMGNMETAEYVWDATRWQTGEFGAFTLTDRGTLAITDCGANGTDFYFGDATGKKETTVQATNYVLNVKGSGLADGTLEYMNIGGFEAFGDPIDGEKNSDGTRLTFNLKDVFEANQEAIVDGELHFLELIANLKNASEGAEVKEINFLSQSKYDLILANEQAQPFDFVDSLWKCTCGAFVIDSTDAGNKITATRYEWGCLGVEFNGSALVSAEKPYVVVKGKNIFPGGSNPNIYEIQLDGVNVNNGQLRMTAEGDSTLCYYNLSSLFSSNEDLRRTDGNFVLNKIGMYLQEPKTADEEVLFLEVDDVMFLSFDELQAMLYGEQTVPDFVFNATDWTGTIGGVNAADGQITANSYEWGCCGIQCKTAYQIDTNNDYLVIRGQNLQQGNNNPCLYALEFSGSDMLAGYKPLMTSTLDSTLVYFNMAGFYEKAADLVKDGKLTLTNIAFYLQEAKDGDGNAISLTVNDIDFITYDELLSLLGKTEGISETMYNEHSTLNIEHCYDLQGRHVESSMLKKGLYIVNGKKVVR